MSIYHGRNARIYIAGYDISALAIALTPAQERELHPYAVLDGVAGYHQMPGLAKDALSIEGLFDDNYMSILKTMFDDGGGKQIVIPFGLTRNQGASRRFSENDQIQLLGCGNGHKQAQQRTSG